MTTPLVSIIIPCYNAGAWVAQTLESALAQTWPHKEIIFVNDGSRDGSLAVAQCFESRGVQVVDQPNQGASAARNHGLRLARGEFIQFLDADDLLAPDKIERQMAVLRDAGPEVLVSAAWGRFTTDLAQAEFVPQAVSAARSGVEFLQLHYETGSMMQPGAWLASRQLLDRAGPWDETLSLNDDGEYFARVMLAAGRLVHVPSARCFYRSGLSTSLSRRSDPRSLLSLFRSVELTTGHLLKADNSPRTQAACADAWTRAAFELYPTLPAQAREAEQNARALGGPRRPMPGSGRFQLAARFLGWRLARRLFR
jgi:glycosyltransferase involved in cell wall biosynthesis